MVRIRRGFNLGVEVEDGSISPSWEIEQERGMRRGRESKKSRDVKG